MIDEKSFLKAVYSAADLYKKDAPSDEWVKVNLAILNSEGITTREFGQAIFQFMKLKCSDEVYNLPSGADILKILNKQPITIERRAELECELVFTNLSGMAFKNKCIFSNKTTNFVLKTYAGGPQRMSWDFSVLNENKKPEDWGRKDFIKRWLASYDLGNESVEPMALAGSVGKIMYGNIIECQKNLEQHDGNLLLANNRASLLLEQTSKALKGKKDEQLHK